MEHAQRAFLRECFAFADASERGYVDLRELKCAVAAALGIRASKLVLAQMFSQLLHDDAQHIESIRVREAEFLAVLLPRLRKTDLLEQIRRSFKALDLRSQGFLSFPVFQTACASVLPHLAPRAMHEIFREADRDGDGRVTYNDFEAIYLLAEQAMQAQPAPPRRPVVRAAHHHRRNGRDESNSTLHPR